jgi:glucosamine--fructose-6-phosphate aminotransferase (isomerizing)
MSESTQTPFPAGYHTRRELYSQPQVWAAAIDQMEGRGEEIAGWFRRGEYSHVIFTGCGSPYFASLAAAVNFQNLTGLPAFARPGSEVWLSPEDLPPLGSRGLLVVSSRSGETSESVRACDTFRKSGRGDVFYIGCFEGRSLEAVSDYTLIIPEAQEESTAQTRALSTMYLATTGLALIAGNRRQELGELRKLVPAGQRMLEEYGELALSVGADLDLDRFYFLGSRAVFGLASELSLKMKEMTLSHSEPFHTLEFRHGPRAMATEGSCVVALLSEQRRGLEQAVLAEMVDQGAQLLTMDEHDADVAFASGLPAPLRDVLYLPIGQLVALERSLAKGLNPDAPENLVAFVTLEEQ